MHATCILIPRIEYRGCCISPKQGTATLKVWHVASSGGSSLLGTIYWGQTLASHRSFDNMKEAILNIGKACNVRNQDNLQLQYSSS